MDWPFEVCLFCGLYWISQLKTPCPGHGCAQLVLSSLSCRLPGQCQYLGLPVADYFKQWINLKKVLCLSHTWALPLVLLCLRSPLPCCLFSFLFCSFCCSPLSFSFLFFFFLNFPLSSSLANMHQKVVAISGSGELGDQAVGQVIILTYFVCQADVQKSPNSGGFPNPYWISKLNFRFKPHYL